LPANAELTIGQVTIRVVHELAHFMRDAQSHHVRVVISGHSHRPEVREHAGILFVNPGSAGPRRFKLPVAVAELTIDGAAVSARIVELSRR
jgi:predicted phosphodiesterase